MHHYESYVAAQSQNNPCFANIQRFLAESTPERDTCRIASFDFVCNDAGSADLRYCLLQPEDLVSAVCPLEDGLKGRILVVEDLSRDVVNTLGSTLEIDPLFFALHIHAPYRAISAQTPNLAMLPSRIRRQNYVSVQYHRPLELPPQFGPERKLVRATNVCRKVAVLPPTRNTCIGLVQHCCSIYFCEKTENRAYWLCLILADPPISHNRLLISENENDRKSGVNLSIDIKHFLRGYEDFLSPVPVNPRMAAMQTLSREGLLGDLLYFWTRELPANLDLDNPTLLSLSVYPLKIVAAEWNNYLAVMSYHIKKYEYLIQGQQVDTQDLDKLNIDLDSLQTWRRRSLASQQKIAAIKLFLEHQAKNRDKEYSEDIEDLSVDFTSIERNLNRYSELLESMLPIVMSLFQVSDSRRSFLEAANVSRLTFLAFVFVPLSFTSSLFSMNSDIAPGGRNFWIYIVVAILISAIVFLLARLPANSFRWIMTRFRDPRQGISPV
ncbi:hypothetical protein UA08_08184 [Talaromyces atroroseus]|uniref:Uncharacterized protein n=1 Tax=Talaromyces atroroseus TaxID=1441469 RepID=A0A225A7F6_TALAT|nr:hypothetical protein UA08_08184 [Talaromyces atroroseus]OKL56432.1 hypothetical protein UA08_08184 [Talaromyces atroroseus]